jgi:hypothetical protein
VSECPAEEYRAKGTACPLDFGFNGGPMTPVSESEEGMEGSSDLQEGATRCRDGEFAVMEGYVG